MSERKKLGEILVELRVLTPLEVERVLQATRRRGGAIKFGQVAKEMGLVSGEHLLAALAVQMGLFPDIEEMSLRRLLGRLREPVGSGTRIGSQRTGGRNLLASPWKGAGQ